VKKLFPQFYRPSEAEMQRLWQTCFFAIDANVLLNIYGYSDDTREELLSLANGKIDTWSVDSDGDFTHTPPQWKNQAWLRPKFEPGELILSIITPTGKQLATETYAVFHGRFIEMILAHFDRQFEEAKATAMAAEDDIVDSTDS
jgi:hypothetical protein